MFGSCPHQTSLQTKSNVDQHRVLHNVINGTMNLDNYSICQQLHNISTNIETAMLSIQASCQLHTKLVLLYLLVASATEGRVGERVLLSFFFDEVCLSWR